MVDLAVPRPRLQGAGVGFQRRKVLNQIMMGAFGACCFLAIVALVLILAYVVIKGLPALNVAFFTEARKPLGEVGGGVLPAIVGTLIMLAVGAVFGLIVGVGSGIYLSEYGQGGRFAYAVRFISDLLAGMPSIAIGVFVWAFLVRHIVGTFSGMAGGVALGVIMIPIIGRTVEEVLRLVPNNLREASLALGVPMWRTIMRIVLPTGLGGVVTGVALAVARAGGETAPLLLTALGNQFFSTNLLRPMAALPLDIYDYTRSPYDDWHTKAWGAALVLILVIGLLNLLTRAATRRRIGQHE